MIIERILRKNKIFLFFIISLLLTITSCNEVIVFEQKINFDNNQWHKDSLIVFTPEIVDTTKNYSFGVTVQHGKHYEYSNLWLFILMANENNSQIKDTVEMFVAEPDGKWIGKKRGNNFSVTAFYKYNVKLAEPSNLSFSFQQGMRSETLNDIKSFEFWVIEE